MTISKKPYPIGSPEARAVIERIREQELFRTVSDGFGHRGGQKSTGPEVKRRAVEMSRQGISQKQIAKMLGISSATVSRIVNRFS